MKTKLLLAALLILGTIATEADARCGRRHRGGGGRFGGCGGQQMSCGAQYGAVYYGGQCGAPVSFTPACANCEAAPVTTTAPVTSIGAPPPAPAPAPARIR